ncbi:MAG: OB-fold nucleic acid binding domain-containing protein [Candidatus Woesearchaeota archaeon]
MEEKNLLKIAIFVSLTGLLLLFFLSSWTGLDPVASLEGIAEEEEVLVAGVVGKVSDQETVLFLEILNEKVEKTEVVLFKEEDVFLSEGDYVEITGTVEDYEGKKEIIANKVVKK